VPAPPADSLTFGPVDIRLYGLCVVLGWVVWIAVTARLWSRGGGDGVEAAWACVLAAPVALVGARVFSVLTDIDAYRGDPGAAFDVQSGGLGIYGAVAGGTLGLLVYARARRWPVGTFLDCAVPGLCLGQAVGRLGNYFNQELFGGPTDLPWGLHVDPGFRPVGYEDVETFHPLFLYEALWDVAVFGALGLLWATLHRRFHPGAVAATYLCLYGIGRFALEGMRLDPAIELGALRVNQVVSLGVVATGFLILVLLDRRRVPR
jgi:phosphatidylglycerol---prolipoprotein diacylglyceryl transferase